MYRSRSWSTVSGSPDHGSCTTFDSSSAFAASAKAALASWADWVPYLSRTKAGRLWGGLDNWWFFPTCQVRVVRFYVSCLLLSSPLLSSPLLSSALLLLLLLHCDPRRTVFSVGPQPRPSTPSVPCRTSTTTIPAQLSLPDLNHDHPRPVFPAGPQPRVSTPSVPCRTSCRKIWDKKCAEVS